MKHRDKHNILHVLTIYYQLHYFIGDQFTHFKNRGYNEHVICSADPRLDAYARKMGFQYMATPINRSISMVDDLRAIWQICRYIRKHHIGIVVGHSPKGGLLAMIAAWLCRVPLRVYFRHGIVYETAHGLLRQVLINCDRLTSLCANRIVCVSPSVCERSIADHLNPKRKQLTLGSGTCTGIDTGGKFNPANIDDNKLNEMRAKWGLTASDWVIGYSGRMVKDKGIPELVAAFEAIKESYPEAKLLLMGPLDPRDVLPPHIEKRIKSGDGIVWTDFIDEDQEYFYAMMNVYVLASYREGFPIGALEAQSMGVPVITTRSTGCRDAILSGKTGQFVEINSKSIGNALTNFIAHGLDKKYSTDARRWVVDNFDYSQIWHHLDNLYNAD